MIVSPLSQWHAFYIQSQHPRNNLRLKPDFGPNGKADAATTRGAPSFASFAKGGYNGRVRRVIPRHSIQRTSRPGELRAWENDEFKKKNGNKPAKQ